MPEETTRGVLIMPKETTRGVLIMPEETTRGALIMPQETTRRVLIMPEETTRGALIKKEFLKISQNFHEYLFYRTPPDDCFCNANDLQHLIFRHSFNFKVYQIPHLFRYYIMGD